jgi:N-acetylneuraminic acid mutarotase
VLLLALFLAISCLIAVKPAFSFTVPAENTWTQKAPMHEARYGIGIAVVNGKIYAIGGSTRSGGGGTIKGPLPVTGGTVGTNEEYDPKTDTWTTKTPMPTPIQNFAIAAYNNKIYCMNGKNEVYNPETDMWETKTPMPTPRGALQANVVDGKIYLIGGDTNGTLNEVYNPETDTWATETPMPTASYGYASAVVDKKIYIIDSNLNQIYDTETDTWSQGAPSPSGFAFGGAAGATTGVNAPKLIYVLGEYSNSREGEPPYFVRVYDPEKDVWTFGSDIPTHRYLLGVAVVDDMLYAIGGFTSSYPDMPFSYPYGPTNTPYATNEQYTPFGYGTIPPKVAVVSPVIGNYTLGNVSLAFTVNKPATWIGYSLDGQDNITITGNITLTGLAVGLHDITIYAKDEFENMGASHTITFSMVEPEHTPEPFPTTLVAAALVASAGVIAVGLLVYFKKRKR